MGANTPVTMIRPEKQVPPGKEPQPFFRPNLSKKRLGLAFTVAAIISNTIQLALASRRNEVEVLRLIGATRGFVSIPFVLEGAVIGLFSSGTALFLLWVLFRLGGNNLTGAAGLLSIPGGFSFLPAAWVPGLILMGIGLGCAGSYWPLRKWN